MMSLQCQRYADYDEDLLSIRMDTQLLQRRL